MLWLDGAGEDYIVARKSFALRTQWTFSTERKFMATRGTSGRGGDVLHIKGAPEVLLAGCDRLHSAEGTGPISVAERAAIAATLAGFQSRGMRTLAFAYRPEAGAAPDPERLTEGLVWLGLVALADPVRAEVPAAVDACRRAGIAIKVVTGDTAATGPPRSPGKSGCCRPMRRRGPCSRGPSSPRSPMRTRGRPPSAWSCWRGRARPTSCGSSACSKSAGTSWP